MNPRAAAHQSCSWSVPVPVRPGGFTALRPEHRELDVVVDLAKVGAFEVPTEPTDPSELLYADLQLNGEMNVRRRLGAGRAGFYHGKYLKGVGRTPLAANWCEPRDTYHATGHMFPSSAIREFIATAYMRARGAEDLIVGCEGVLLRPMVPALAAGIGRFEATCDGPFPAADRVLQAISVKPGDFARLSNFIWLLSFIRPSPRNVADFAYRLAMYSRPPSAPSPVANLLSPLAVVDELRQAVDRGVRNFIRHFELGIYWGSYFNNFTIDGRFLDLEVPLVHGSPFVGKLCDHPSPTLHRAPEEADGTLLGVELFDFVHHVRAALKGLESLLTWRRDLAGDPMVRDFLGGMLDELSTELGPDHLVHSREGLCSLVTDALVNCGGEPTRVDNAVRYEYDSLFRLETGPRPALGLEVLPGTLAPPEPTRWSTAFAATALLADPSVTKHWPTAEAELVNELLLTLDAMTDVDELLAALADAEQTILREVSRLPAAPLPAVAEGA